MFCSLMTEKRKQKFIILISRFCKALEESRHSGMPEECQRNGITVSTYLWQSQTVAVLTILACWLCYPIFHFRKHLFLFSVLENWNSSAWLSELVLLPKVALSSPLWNSSVSPKRDMNFRQRRSTWKGN